MLPSGELSDGLGVGSQELLLPLVTPPGPDRWSLPMGSHRSGPLVWPQQRAPRRFKRFSLRHPKSVA
jgi:hypothetical protein